MTATRLATVVIVLASAAPAPATLTLSFMPGDCAARSTHVVVTDGSGEILESWVGDLKPGDTVPVGKFKLKLEQEVTPLAYLNRDEGIPAKDRPTKVTGNRLVVFLVKDGWAYDGTPPVDGWGAGECLGKDFDISVGWVEGGLVFGNTSLGPSIPGPYGLGCYGTEASIKKIVLDVRSRLREQLGKAKAGKDPDAKVRALVALIDEGTDFTGPAFDELAACGEAGLKAITKDNRGAHGPAAAAHVVRALRRYGPAAKDPLMAHLRVAFKNVRFFADRPGFPRGVDPALWAEVETLRRLLGAPEVYVGLTAAERAVLTQVVGYFADRPALAEYGEKGDRVPDRIAAVLAGPRK
ncbi:MAG: hypothetical protein K2X82_00030 [Gemmataceae bacterium]|nr:hypothetical protein [Gemmataceae bacterium]